MENNDTIFDGIRLRGRGPFAARSANDRTDNWPFWYVAGPDGRRNVLTFLDQPGAVFACREDAEYIAAKGNALA